MPNRQVRTPEYYYRQLPVEHLSDHFPGLSSEIAGRAIFIVRADINPAGTFKAWGIKEALQFAPEGIEEVVCNTAGNHGLGAAAVCARAGVPARFFVPKSAPAEKREPGLRRLWIERGGDPHNLTVVETGQSFDDTIEPMQEYLGEMGDKAFFLHPYDNADAIAGRGKLLKKALSAVPDTSIVGLPVGGGSLLDGFAQAAQKMDNVEIRGFEAPGSNSLSKSLRSGSIDPLEADNPNAKYKGSAVLRTGPNVLRDLQRIGFSPNALSTVLDEDVTELATMYHEDGTQHTMLEPTSLVAVAGMLRLIRYGDIPEDRVVTILGTGHNESPFTLFNYGASMNATIHGHIGSRVAS